MDQKLRAETVMNPDDAASLLRERGQRLTPQRMLILDILRNHAEPLTAKEIADELHSHMPTVNVVTVYRTLSWLEEHGLVQVIKLPDASQTRYERISASPHHHLVCRSCGTEIEIDDRLVDGFREEVTAKYGFAVEIDHLAISGVCAGCQDAK